MYHWEGTQEKYAFYFYVLSYWASKAKLADCLQGVWDIKILHRALHSVREMKCFQLMSEFCDVHPFLVFFSISIWLFISFQLLKYMHRLSWGEHCLPQRGSGPWLQGCHVAIQPWVWHWSLFWLSIPTEWDHWSNVPEATLAIKLW